MRRSSVKSPPSYRRETSSVEHQIGHVPAQRQSEGAVLARKFAMQRHAVFCHPGARDFRANTARADASGTAPRRPHHLQHIPRPMLSLGFEKLAKATPGVEVLEATLSTSMSKRE